MAGTAKKRPAHQAGAERQRPRKAHGRKSLIKGPTSELKKSKQSPRAQLRGVERLLRKDYLDARLRRGLELRREQLKAAVAAHKQKEREEKYAARYQKVRFFERVKLERRIKHLRAQEASPAQQQQLQEALDSLQYVVHFPRGEKYVSIIRQADDPQAQAHLEAERARLHGLVRQQIAEMAMITEADEGLGTQRQWQHVQQPAQPPDSAPEQAGSRNRKRQREAADEFFLASDADESDAEASDRSPGPGQALPAAERQPAVLPLAHATQTAAEPRKHAQRVAWPKQAARHGRPAERAAAQREARRAPEAQQHAGNASRLRNAPGRAAPQQQRKTPLSQRRPVLHTREPSKKQGSLSQASPLFKPRPAAAARKAPVQADKPQQPLRTRAEGGRKRRRK